MLHRLQRLQGVRKVTCQGQSEGATRNAVRMFQLLHNMLLLMMSPTSAACQLDNSAWVDLKIPLMVACLSKKVSKDKKKCWQLTCPLEVCGCQVWLDACALELQVVQSGEGLLVIPLSRQISCDRVVTGKVPGCDTNNTTRAAAP